MSEQWFKEYALLALRIDRLTRKQTELPYVDGYYGPPAWKAQVEGEPEMQASDLVPVSMALAAELAEQQLEPQRSAYLAKNLVIRATITPSSRSTPICRPASSCWWMTSATRRIPAITRNLS